MLIEVHETCFNGDNITSININQIVSLACGSDGTHIKTTKGNYEVKETREELHKLINETHIKAQEEALERHRIMLIRANPTVANGGLV